MLRASGCVFAEDEARLILDTAGSPAVAAAMAERRAAGFPLEHVLGWARFAGLRIAVDAGVFVPRVRSEFLVAEATVRAAAIPTEASASPDGPVVVDLCCGSGAIGAAVAAGLERVSLYASDIDPAAVRCARRNVAPYGGRVFEGDLYAPLPAALRGRVDVLIANAPYVPTDEIAFMPPEARLHEPRVALDGGSDGLDVQRRVVADAPAWLAPGGHLLIETSERQAPHTAEAFARAGLETEIAESEEWYATVVIGTRPRRS
ncbi:putative protein N(5)-glutamine methyltransferase [Yinghuangia seranimata]|uniref:putative protein N(5)-glutamine methyltransferase n=1 Tax=Yinghuangia seranimata TaxID=408067 RepID=UPI00248B7E9F|nr:putative protein N(5)-glutamine methyltransferase [Yinghuangia seranimata]MDI2125701.1 putative protein N(5)-glutamine methyltransferase [Yinghuangia seranimata]